MTTSQTLQRLERLLTVVPWLLEHPGADVGEISERLGVPRDELLADLDMLGYCGLPGYGGGDLIEVTIIGDHVTLRMADYFRRPLRLSVREAVTLLLSARALGGVSGLDDSGALARAAARLESALGIETGDVARVAIDLRAPGDEHLPELRRAVESRRLVVLRYRSDSRGETTDRHVEPWTLTATGGAWYLQGHCRTAGGPRDFRLDRIRSLRVLEESTPPPTAPPAPPVYRPGPDDPEVVLDLDRPAWWLTEFVVTDDVATRGRRRRITFRVHHLDWAARLVLRLEGRVRVVSPPELTSRVRTLATDAVTRYEANT
jgi:predicted DNA-binding transcriptional regulator YafY